MNFTRQLLSKEFYPGINEAQSKDYDTLLNDFMTIYKNREMLKATDWASSVKYVKYFGFYGWVISHTDVNGQLVKDKNGVPHTGKNGAGRLAYIQFKSTGFLNAFNNFVKSKSSAGASPASWVPNIFNNHTKKAVALNITYGQDQTKKFSGSISDNWFANQINHLVNDPATDPTNYTLPSGLEEVILDFGREFLNVKFEGNLYEERHVDDFRSAVKAVIRSFEFFSAHGADAYDRYSQELGFNTPISGEVGTTEQAPTGAALIQEKINAAKQANPLMNAASPAQQPAQGIPNQQANPVGGWSAPSFGQPGAPTQQGGMQQAPQFAQGNQAAPQAPQFTQQPAQQPQAPQFAQPTQPVQPAQPTSVQPQAPLMPGTQQAQYSDQGSVAPQWGATQPNNQ